MGGLALVLLGVLACRPTAWHALASAFAAPQGSKAQADQPADAPADQAQGDDLAQALRAICQQHDLPALAVLSARWDDAGASMQIHTRAQVGVRSAASDKAVGPDDLWHIGSCTKAFTATLLATYVAEGRLAWDDTLATALPDLAELMSPPVRSRTVADLLRHRAGMPANASPRLFAQLRTMDAATGRAEVVREALMTARAVHEHDEPAYSNTGYVVAGAICERLGGKPWEQLLVERVLRPLGITDEQFGFGAPPIGPDPAAPVQPMGHRRVGRGWMPIAPGPLADNPPAYGPAGTLHLTLPAWARFCMAHARGQDLPLGQRDALGLSSEDYAALHQATQGMAAGWLVVQRPWARAPDEPQPGPDAGLALTHAGSNTAWYAVAWIAPERNWVLLAATNAAGPQAPQATDRAVGLALARLLESSPQPPR